MFLAAEHTPSHLSWNETMLHQTIKLNDTQNENNKYEMRQTESITSKPTVCILHTFLFDFQCKIFFSNRHPIYSCYKNNFLLVHATFLFFYNFFSRICKEILIFHLKKKEFLYQLEYNQNFPVCISVTPFD